MIVTSAAGVSLADVLGLSDSLTVTLREPQVTWPQHLMIELIGPSVTLTLSRPIVGLDVRALNAGLYVSCPSVVTGRGRSGLILTVEDPE